jgi:5'-nucleotidase
MKRVLVDIDGVAGDFVGAWLELVYECTGRRYEREQLTQCDLAAAIGLHASEKSRIEIAMRRQQFCARIQPIIGAVSGLAELRRVAEVRIVTKPLPDSPLYGPSIFWCTERLQWLERHFGIPASEVYLCSDKQGIRGDILVDDDPKNLTGFQGRALLWTRPHNQSATEFERITAWQELLSEVGSHQESAATPSLVVQTAGHSL